MTWQRVIMLAVFVAGGVGAIALGSEPMAALLFGAAAASAPPPHFGRSSTREHEDRP